MDISPWLTWYSRYVAVCVLVICVAKTLPTVLYIYSTAILIIATSAFSYLCREVGKGDSFGRWDV